MKKFKSIQERIDVLNKNSDKRSILNSIDRPIRPLVLEINRIGLYTHFSCCGFTYKDEEEPKSHATHPYVYFRVPGINFKGLDSSEIKTENLQVFYSFFELGRLAKHMGWNLQLGDNGVEWILIDGNSYNPPWKSCDNLSETIHDYETKLCKISVLEKALKQLPTVRNKIKIRDGNESRVTMYGPEWIVAPKKMACLKI